MGRCVATATQQSRVCDALVRRTACVKLAHMPDIDTVHDFTRWCRTLVDVRGCRRARVGALRQLTIQPIWGI